MVMIGIQLAVASTLAVLAYLQVDTCRWLDVVPAVMICMSILAAAVLFRLGRGLPQLPVERLNTERVTTLTTAYVEVARRLAFILAFTTLALLTLAIARLALTEREELIDWPIAEELMAVSVFFSALALVRGIALVKGDVDLVRLQASLTKDEVVLRRAEESKSRLEGSQKNHPFKMPENYGGLATFEAHPKSPD